MVWNIICRQLPQVSLDDVKFNVAYYHVGITIHVCKLMLVGWVGGVKVTCQQDAKLQDAI